MRDRHHVLVPMIDSFSRRLLSFALASATAAAVPTTSRRLPLLLSLVILLAAGCSPSATEHRNRSDATPPSQTAAQAPPLAPFPGRDLESPRLEQSGRAARVSTPGGETVGSEGPSSRGPFPAPLIVSVQYFEDHTSRADLLWLREALVDMLEDALARRPDLIVIQRQRLDRLLQDQPLEQGSRLADEATVRLGRMLGATALVIGRMSVEDERVRLEAHVLGVERGALLGTATAEGPLTQAPTVAADLVERVLRLFPGREAVVPAESAS